MGRGRGIENFRAQASRLGVLSGLVVYRSWTATSAKHIFCIHSVWSRSVTHCW